MKRELERCPAGNMWDTLTWIFHLTFSVGRGFWEQNPTGARHFGETAAEPDAKTR